MSVIEVDKQINQFLNNQDKDLSDAEDEDWNSPIPQYEFPERARIVEAFYRPEAEILDNDLALARRNSGYKGPDGSLWAFGAYSLRKET